MGRDELDNLFEKEYKFFFRIVYRIAQNIEDTEDILQDAYIKACHSKSSDIKSDELKRWFVVVCRSSALTYLRKKSKEIRREQDYIQSVGGGEPKGVQELSDSLISVIIEASLMEIPAEIRPAFEEYMTTDISLKMLCSKHGVSRDKMRYWKKKLENYLKFLLE